MIFCCYFTPMKTTQITNARLLVIPSYDNSLKYSAYIQTLLLRSESCRVLVLEISLMSNLYFIYKYIKPFYALLVKSSKYIKTQAQTNVRIWIEFLFVCCIFRKSFSRKIYSHIKKTLLTKTFISSTVTF